MVFLISGLGYFTFLYQHTKYTTERVEEKNNHGLGLTPSVSREKSVTLLCILWANASVYLREILTKPLRILNHLLALVNPEYSKVFLDRQLPPTSVDWSVRPTSLDCFVLSTDLWDLPSLVLYLLCGFRAKTDKRVLRVASTPTETNAQHRVTTIVLMTIRCVCLTCECRVRCHAIILTKQPF